MKRLSSSSIAALVCLIIATAPALGQEDPLLPISFPGMLEGTGTYFVLDDEIGSFVVDSSEPIRLSLTAFNPNAVEIMIESTTKAAEAEITLAGFSPHLTLYGFQDDPMNKFTVQSDAEGTVHLTQELTSLHLVHLQPTHSTVYLNHTDGFHDGAGGSLNGVVGTWDPVTRTGTLTTDLNEQVRIGGTDVTLDGAGHLLTFPGDDYAVWLAGTRNTLKNLNVDLDYRYGVRVYNCTDCAVINNRFRETDTRGIFGVKIEISQNLTVKDNVVDLARDNAGAGIYGGRVGEVSGNLVLRGTHGAYVSGLGSWVHCNVCTDSGVGITGAVTQGALVENNTIGGAIQVGDDAGTSVVRNNIATGYGGLYLDNTTGNEVYENHFEGTAYGLYMIDSPSNVIYNNNFVSTVAPTVTTSPGNVFHLPAPIGGNYWSLWTTPDIDADGFVDVPYILGANQDDLPYTGQFGWQGMNPPINIVSPPILQFGLVTRGMSMDSTFVVTHTGAGTLDGEITENSDHFSIVLGEGPFSLADGESHTVVVRYEPLAAGYHYCIVQTGTGCSGLPCTGMADDAVPAVLSSYSARWVEDAVEVVWALAGVQGRTSAEILRAEGSSNRFVPLPDAEVTLTGRDTYRFRDDTAAPGQGYTYRVTIREDGLVVAWFKAGVSAWTLPLALEQNRPNPFQSSTRIDFTLPEEMAVLLRVYDVRGRAVRTLVRETRGPGRHMEVWDGYSDGGEAVGSGVYFFKLSAGDQVLTRKALVLKE